MSPIRLENVHFSFQHRREGPGPFPYKDKRFPFSSCKSASCGPTERKKVSAGSKKYLQCHNIIASHEWTHYRLMNRVLSSFPVGASEPAAVCRFDVNLRSCLSVVRPIDPGFSFPAYDWNTRVSIDPIGLQKFPDLQDEVRGNWAD